MTSRESKLTFFRQSGWMVLSNTLCGVFMAAVHPVVSVMPVEEYGVFGTMLRLFALLAIPAVGLQTAFAHQTAAAVDERRERQLAATLRGLLAAVLSVWVALAAATALAQNSLMRTLQVESNAVIWLTALASLAIFCLPVFQGVLQGRQSFSWWGWSMMANGAGRFAATLIFVSVAGARASSGLLGAFLGAGGAILVGAWPLRKLLAKPGAPVEWRLWLRRVTPLSLGAGSVVFVTSADMLIVQTHFDKSVTGFYAAAAMIGFALMIFTMPLAAVMFPKIVRSVARSESTSALLLPLAVTAALSASGAAVCTIFPTLPLHLLFPRNAEYLRIAPLVPWFAWAMTPLTVGNVLIANLMARGYFRPVPWLTAAAAAHGLVLLWYARTHQDAEPFEAFQRIVQILGVTSLILFSIAFRFTWLHRRETVRAS